MKLRISIFVFTNHLHAAKVKIFASPTQPPNSYVEILNPKGNGISKWKLWQVLKSHVGLNPHEWDFCLIKAPERSLAPSTM